LNYGSFVPKEKISNFLRQIGNLKIKTLFYLDIYFVIFSNEFPLNLVNEIPLMKLSPLEESEIKNEKKKENFERLLMNSLSILHSNLLNSNQNDFLSGDLIPGLHLRDSRSACKKDDCIFFTNIDSFPSPLSTKYDPDSTLKKHLSKLNENYPEKNFFLKNYYFNAIDDDTNTCWKSNRSLSFILI
jgi:hypothetical protein